MNAKTLLLAALLVVANAFPALAKTVHTRGYTTKSGTVVQPYDRTSPNGTLNDNWSTRGNTNPKTGVAGTRPGDPTVGELRVMRVWNGYAYVSTTCRWDGRQWSAL